MLSTTDYKNFEFNRLYELFVKNATLRLKIVVVWLFINYQPETTV